MTVKVKSLNAVFTCRILIYRFNLTPEFNCNSTWYCAFLQMNNLYGTNSALPRRSPYLARVNPMLHRRTTPSVNVFELTSALKTSCILVAIVGLFATHILHLMFFHFAVIKFLWPLFVLTSWLCSQRQKCIQYLFICRISWRLVLSGIEHKWDRTTCYWMRNSKPCSSQKNLLTQCHQRLNLMTLNTCPIRQYNEDIHSKLRIVREFNESLTFHSKNSSFSSRLTNLKAQQISLSTQIYILCSTKVRERKCKLDTCLEQSSNPFRSWTLDRHHGRPNRQSQNRISDMAVSQSSPFKNERRMNL